MNIQVPRSVAPVKYEHERPAWHPPELDKFLALIKNPNAFKRTKKDWDEIHRVAYLPIVAKIMDRRRKKRLAKVRRAEHRITILPTLSGKQVAYRKYLKSAHWKQLRNRKLDICGCECNRCGSHSHIQVHHNIYRSRWEDALLSDLEVLCRGCHEKEHGIV